MPYLKEKLELELEEAELRASQALGRYPKTYIWSAILFFTLLIPGYFIVKSVSHSYWQGQYAKSALTAHPAFTSALAPQIGAITLTTAGTGVYSAAVQISNPNLELALPSTNYEFRFYDAGHTMIRNSTGKLFLLPNDTKYLVAARVTSDKEIVSAELVLPDKLNWQKRLNIPKVTFSVQQPNFYNATNPTAFTVEGKFQNQSSYELKEVVLTVLLYDSSGKMLGASQRSEFTVAPSELRSYKVEWPNVYTDQVTRVQVYATTNTLDDTNIALPSGSSPSSGLGR